MPVFTVDPNVDGYHTVTSATALWTANDADVPLKMGNNTAGIYVPGMYFENTTGSSPFPNTGAFINHAYLDLRFHVQAFGAGSFSSQQTYAIVARRNVLESGTEPATPLSGDGTAQLQNVVCGFYHLTNTTGTNTAGDVIRHDITDGLRQIIRHASWTKNERITLHVLTRTLATAYGAATEFNMAFQSNEVGVGPKLTIDWTDSATGAGFGSPGRFSTLAEESTLSTAQDDTRLRKVVDVIAAGETSRERIFLANVPQTSNEGWDPGYRPELYFFAQSDSTATGNPTSRTSTANTDAFFRYTLSYNTDDTQGPGGAGWVDIDRRQIYGWWMAGQARTQWYPINFVVSKDPRWRAVRVQIELIDPDTDQTLTLLAFKTKISRATITRGIDNSDVLPTRTGVATTTVTASGVATWQFGGKAIDCAFDPTELAVLVEAKDEDAVTQVSATTSTNATTGNWSQPLAIPNAATYGLWSISQELDVDRADTWAGIPCLGTDTSATLLHPAGAVTPLNMRTGSFLGMGRGINLIGTADGRLEANAATLRTIMATSPWTVDFSMEGAASTALENATQYLFGIWGSTSADQQFYFSRNFTGITFQVRNASLGLVTVSETYTNLTGQPFCAYAKLGIMVTWNGSLLKLYVNGEEWDSVALTSMNTPSSSVPFVVGGRNSTEFGSGAISDLRVSNIVRQTANFKNNLPAYFDKTADANTTNLWRFTHSITGNGRTKSGGQQYNQTGASSLAVRLVPQTFAAEVYTSDDTSLSKYSDASNGTRLNRGAPWFGAATWFNNGKARSITTAIVDFDDATTDTTLSVWDSGTGQSRTTVAPIIQESSTTGNKTLAFKGTVNPGGGAVNVATKAQAESLNFTFPGPIVTVSSEILHEHHMQHNNATFSRALDQTSRLTTDLSFLSSRVMNIRREGINGVGVDTGNNLLPIHQIQDISGLSSAVILKGDNLHATNAAEQTATFDGQRGWLGLSAWSSSLPGGLWVHKVSVTNYKSNASRQTGADDWTRNHTLFANDAAIRSVSNIYNGTKLKARWMPGHDLVVAIGAFHSARLEFLKADNDATTPDARIAIWKRGANGWEAYNGSAWVRLDTYLETVPTIAAAKVLGDIGHYQVTVPTNKITWPSTGLSISGFVIISGVSYHSMVKIDGSVDQYSVDPIGLALGGIISTR